MLVSVVRFEPVTFQLIVRTLSDGAIPAASEVGCFKEYTLEYG